SRRAQAAAAYEPGGAPGATHPGHPQGRRALMGCQVPMRHRALAGCRAPIPCPVRSYRNAEASCSYCKVLGMPRIVDHAARRTEIVYALWAVIHEKGLDSVSFRAVAEAAGVSIGRIQHYFTSKEELIREGCAQIVAAAEVPDGAGPCLTLWHLVTSPIPSTPPRRIGVAVWYAYLAKSVSEPALREIITGAVDTACTEATALLHAARAERGGGADGSEVGADGAGSRTER